MSGLTGYGPVADAIYEALNGSFGDFGADHAKKAADAVEAIERDLPAALQELRDAFTVQEIVLAAIKGQEWCCEYGCGSGACESCPCCQAGWCVTGFDFKVGGWPEDGEDVGRWLEIAAEHNPIAAQLAKVWKADS